ncbi:MAG: hypothetical protein RL759_44 [Verrucomicrobiota bacterium]
MLLGTVRLSLSPIKDLAQQLDTIKYDDPLLYDYLYCHYCSIRWTNFCSQSPITTVKKTDWRPIGIKFEDIPIVLIFLRKNPRTVTGMNRYKFF